MSASCTLTAHLDKKYFQHVGVQLKGNLMILGRIRTELESLPVALRRVGEAILADPAAAANWAISVLARYSGSSPASVTRFARAFGFDGYTQLRVALAAEAGRAEQAGWGVSFGHDIGPEDKLEWALAAVAADDARLIQETLASLDPAGVDAVAEKIAGAGRLLLFGSGSSGHVARLGASHFREIGVPAWGHTETHDALSHASMLVPGDVAIGLSHQGRTSEVLQAVAEAAGQGATTVAVTSFARSPLASRAEHVLLTGAREMRLRRGALSAVHSQLFVIDALYIAVAQRTYQRTTEGFRRTRQAIDRHRHERT
jgi:DNA-binding MurR/RpiR family transcriptional regulator